MTAARVAYSVVLVMEDGHTPFICRLLWRHPRNPQSNGILFSRVRVQEAMVPARAQRVLRVLPLLFLISQTQWVDSMPAGHPLTTTILLHGRLGIPATNPAEVIASPCGQRVVQIHSSSPYPPNPSPAQSPSPLPQAVLPPHR